MSFTRTSTSSHTTWASAWSPTRPSVSFPESSRACVIGHAVFDADHAILPGPVPRHPGDRASEAHPVQEVGGRRGGAERAVQLRLPVFLLATWVAEGRRVLAPRHGRDLVLIFSMNANIVTKITANGRFREPQCARMTTPNHNQPDESASAPLFPCLALAPPQPHNWHARDKRSRLQS